MVYSVDAEPDTPVNIDSPIPLDESIKAVERLLRPLEAGVLDSPWANDPAGGPKPIHPSVHLTPNFIRTAGLLAVRGFSEEEIAEAFGVGLSEVRTWEREYPDFKETLSRCKDVQDAAVERSLYNIATGYSHPAIDIKMDKDGIVSRIPYIKHYPPDLGAVREWLHNRRPDKWKPIAAQESVSQAPRITDNRVQVVVFSPHAGKEAGAIAIRPDIINPEE